MSTRTNDALRTVVADCLAGIAPEASLDKIDSNGPFREQLDIDSMDFLALIVALKTRLGVEVPEADYGQLTSLTRIIAYLQQHAP
jgi:acyl carrier protein